MGTESRILCSSKIDSTIVCSSMKSNLILIKGPLCERRMKRRRGGGLGKLILPRDVSWSQVQQKRERSWKTRKVLENAKDPENKIKNSSNSHTPVPQITGQNLKGQLPNKTEGQKGWTPSFGDQNKLQVSKWVQDRAIFNVQCGDKIH